MCIIYKSHEITKIYDAEAARYDDRYKKPIHLVEAAIVSEHIQNMYFDGLRRSSYRPVLDIGCGTGHAIR